MTTVLLPAPPQPTRPTSAPTLNWRARWIRAAILRCLTQVVAEGQLELTDPWERRSLGSPSADGLAAHLAVHDPRAYQRIADSGTLGFAEGYIAGEWQTTDLTALLRLFVRNHEAIRDTQRAAGWRVAWARWLHRWRRNNRRGSVANIAAHYDLGNDFFARWLDPTMTYSAAVYPSANADLASAQRCKLARICQRLELCASDHLLDIGCGWGALAIYAARHHGCRVTATTISKQQYALARERVAAAGLAERVTVVLADYRDLRGSFDKLVSIEMIEAVGHQYLDTYFARCAALLAPHGAMLLQAITFPDRRWHEHIYSTDFLQQVIFPGSCLPSITAIANSVGRTDLRLALLEELTPHYARTLHDWRQAFQVVSAELLDAGRSESFLRCWDYYLASCEAAFAERHLGVVQVLLTKPRSRAGLNLPILEALHPDPYTGWAS
jgi:cyclopropane-fatty-acyl-phospholipid synthase